MKNRKTAALLAIFFGGVGVHKFYLNDAGSGIFYIMLTIFGANLGVPIGSILGWIDAFTFLTMSDERFDKKYNSSRRIKRSNNRTERRSNRNERTSTRTNRRSERYNYEERKTNRASKNPYKQPARKRKVIKDNPFKTSGIKRLKDFELDLAEADLMRALELSPDDIQIHFSLGKLFSLNENKQKSFYHLAKAVNLGFADINQMRTTDELAYLRIQPEFEVFEQSGFRVVPREGEKSAPTQNEAPKVQEQNQAPSDDLLQDDLLLSQLNKLAELRKKGLLSEKEFQEEKIKLTRR